MTKLDKQLQELLDKNKKKIGYEFDFPRFKILPDEVLLALKVLKNNGMKVIIKLDDNS